MITIKTFNSFNYAVIFHYVNWKGEPHTYLVKPESVEFGPYTEQGKDIAVKNWVLHAQVVQRDGEWRPGRRTFLLSKIEEVPA